MHRSQRWSSVPLDDLSDEELLDSYLAGTEAAYEILMRRHEDRIFGLAYRMMGNRPDALDATQETFVLAFRRASSFRGESSFGTWLYRIGINACRDLLRGRARLPEPQADPEPTGSSPGVDQDAVERLVVSRALASIPEEYRRAVALHDLAGVPYEEIAKIEVVPIGTIKSRISRGRRLLRAALEQQESLGPSKERR
jgi:RNA polymerase sigma-70 factor (ECF subfamily)